MWPPTSSHFDRWIADLEARHLADLTFSEVSRGLRALSSAYVERRGRLSDGGALSGAGKRAAFALFYGPLHYLLVREIVRQLPAADPPIPSIVDLGCGTGAAGAAWAETWEKGVGRGFRRDDAENPSRPLFPKIVGIDRHPWAVQEAARTYAAFGRQFRTRQADVSSTPLPTSPSGFVAAFTVNELQDAARDRLLTRLLERARGGHRLLIVEPIARAMTPWWDAWRAAIVAAGGRADEWRFPANLPPIVARLDRAAGLDHRELTARSLIINWER